MSGVPWTPEEDAIVRRGYGRRDALEKIAARLPGRTVDGLKARARTLKCRRRPRWSAREDRILRMEWGEILNRRTWKEKLPGRTWCAISRRAQALKLGSPAQGMVSLKAAARATGYSFLGLLGVLRRQNVTMRRHCGAHQRTRAYTWFLLDLVEVEEAVARDIREAAETETIREAADRYGVTPPTARRRLLRAGAIGEGITHRGQPARLARSIVDAAMRGEHVGPATPVPLTRRVPTTVRGGAAALAEVAA